MATSAIEVSVTQYDDRGPAVGSFGSIAKAQTEAFTVEIYEKDHRTGRIHVHITSARELGSETEFSVDLWTADQVTELFDVLTAARDRAVAAGILP